MNWKIIHFSEASITPSVRSSIHQFLQIILAGAKSVVRHVIESISDDLCLFF